MATFTVEGDLSAALQEDSDSDSSISLPEDEDQVDHGGFGRPAAAGLVDDEEEIEVFTSAGSHPEVAHSLPKQVKGATAGVGVAGDQSAGIRKATTESYSHRSVTVTFEPQAVVTEREAVVSQEEDDEFAVFEASNTNDETLRNLLMQSHNKESELVKNDRVDFSEEINALAVEDSLREALAWPSAAVAPQNPEEPLILDTATKVSSISLDARKALTDIVDVYGQGMGDQEVLLLDLPSQQTSSPIPPTLLIGGALDAIEEEDEEEGEEEEEVGANEDRGSDEIRSGAMTEFDDIAAANGNLCDAPQQDEWGVPTASCTSEEQFSCFPYDDALSFCLSQDLSRFRSSIVIVEEPQQKGWLSGWRKPPELNASRAKEIEIPFLLAQLDYDPFVPQHLAMLRTIYVSLISSSEAPPGPTDGRWEQLGFQGSDPRTDLNRSMKILSVIQALHFLHSNAAFFKQVFKLSGSDQPALPRALASEDTSWPFMCVMVMFTKEAIQALRSQQLNKHCNAQGSVLGVLQLFVQACFFEFCTLLMQAPKVHHANQLAVVRKSCADSPSRLLKRYLASERCLPDHLLKSSADKSSLPNSEKEGEVIRFDNLENLSEDMISISGADLQQTTGGKAARFLA
eukprot:gene4405-4827_t